MYAGFELVQIDECTFGANQYGAHHWAQAGNPLIKNGKYSQQKYVSVCGAISASRGLVHYTMIEG